MMKQILKCQLCYFTSSARFKRHIEDKTLYFILFWFFILILISLWSVLYASNVTTYLWFTYISLHDEKDESTQNTIKLTQTRKTYN